MDINTLNELLAIAVVNNAVTVANRKSKGRMTATQKTAYNQGLWYLSIRGYSYAEIGVVMGQTRGNIQQHMKKIIDGAMSNIYAEIEYERRMHYAMYMNLYKEALTSWIISKRGKQKVTRKQYRIPEKLEDDYPFENDTDLEINDDLPMRITTVVESNLAGDVAFLNAAAGFLEKAEKLMGMDLQIKDDLDWISKLTAVGLDDREIFNITVIEMQAKIGKGASLSGGGEYDYLADPNVKNLIDAEYTMKEEKE